MKLCSHAFEIPRNSFVVHDNCGKQLPLDEAMRYAERLCAWIDLCGMAPCVRCIEEQGLDPSICGQITVNFSELARRWGKRKETVISWVMRWEFEKRIIRVYSPHYAGNLMTFLLAHSEKLEPQTRLAYHIFSHSH